MTDYAAPITDMQFALHQLAGLNQLNKLPGLQAATDDVVEAVLTEASRFAGEVLAPLNRTGDSTGARFSDNAVTSVPGFAAAYQDFVAGGWPALPFAPELGGQGLPEVVAAAANEIWQSANMAFALCPMLTEGAVVAMHTHASEALQQTYLPKLVTGEWTGTMNLTEPQAGSDLAAVKTRAVPEGEHYLISGQKIYITWGDHDLTDNIMHLVLARTPEAPPGIKGISLFLVPKFLLNADGSPGKRNDVYPVSIEHKLGIHASPTCVMSYGDNGGAVGYLVGELHDGIGCMFTMMNHARIAVGIQGLSISERAYQQARHYAKDRQQGRTPGKQGRALIIDHADVRRMLMFMRAGTEAMRALAYVTAASLDIMHHAEPDEDKEHHAMRFALLTPVVKGWSSELAQELTSLGIQVHGGMGYVEETGAAQHYRDARIISIYEGTTGIQAQDLIGRKIIRDNGKAVTALLAEMRAVQTALDSRDTALKIIAARLQAAIDDLDAACQWVLANFQDDYHVAGSVAVNFLMLMGTVCGGWQMARAAAIAAQDDSLFNRSKVITARFYAEHFLPRTTGYLTTITAGSEAVMALDVAQF